MLACCWSLEASSAREQKSSNLMLLVFFFLPIMLNCNNALLCWPLVVACFSVGNLVVVTLECWTTYNNCVYCTVKILVLIS